METLDVRAAKCLDCSLDYTGTKITMWPDSLVSVLGDNKKIGSYHAIHDLKFKSSYDWAMLGVKAYLKKYEDNMAMHIFNLENKIIDIMGPDLNCEESADRWSLLRWLATPAQITQAWVELSEENNG